jgi:hydroxymethylbilane synthase
VASPSQSPILRLGTRGGDLALWQAHEVARLVLAAHPHVRVDIRVIRTTGDGAPAMPVAQIGGTGVFTREIEQALGDGTIDLAVHSLKDLPTRLTDGLTLAAVLERGDPRDALVAPAGTRLADLPSGARIGTSSARRRALLLAQRPQLSMLDVRGNVPTRLAKLDRGEYDALVLARAGLQRLGLDHRVAETLDPAIVAPAPGQGAIAVETRAGDLRVTALLHVIDHAPTRLATCAERALLSRLEGGCQAPIGALATWEDGTLALAGVAAAPGGERTVRGSSREPVRTEAEAEAAGIRLAEFLLGQGAAEILADVRLRRNTGRAADRTTP